MMKLQLESLLTCPICGHAEMLAMPTDACQWFHQCPSCNTEPGDCCVFCAYGSVPCPPIQMAHSTGKTGCCG
ncbi:MAG: GDCCVxC domain-containing (seleno)protein [Gallionella sp.]|nr:GDCCVxC domain-containing (seleno)protein [Gallionella sp.]